MRIPTTVQKQSAMAQSVLPQPALENFHLTFTTLLPFYPQRTRWADRGRHITYDNSRMDKKR